MEVRNGSQWRVPRTFEFESTSCCGPREHLQQEKQLFAQGVRGNWTGAVGGVPGGEMFAPGAGGSGNSYGRLSAPPALYGLFKVWHNILLNHLVNESAATVTPAVILGQNQIFPN